MRLLQLIVVCAAGAAGAQTLEEFEARFSVYAQDGRGWQSVDAAEGEPGSERATIVEPLMRALLRGGAWTHDGIIDVDIVTAASPDAVDAVSNASKVNTAIALDVTSTHEGGNSLRYGLHLEEPLRSFFLGGGARRGFAEENTVLAASALLTFDVFDLNRHDATEGGIVHRTSLNGNLSLRQILSPTTVLDAGYGFTLQLGTLQTTYNSVPLEGGGRGGERLPARRARHALSAAVEQLSPATRTAARASYRFYVDDFGLTAHTAQLWLAQRARGWLLLRAGYRHHVQSGVDFWGEQFTDEPMTPRTSDSDLARFVSRQIDLQLGVDTAGWSLVGACARYWRDNDLQSTIVSVAWSQRFP
jgi:hypothetical protein